jgi:hypothetical protein
LRDLKTWTALMMGTAVWLVILAYAATHAYDLFIPHFKFPWQR